MEKDARYHVLYRHHSGNGRTYLREFVGVYLGPDSLKREQFSLRPASGTSWIEKEQILSYERTTEEAYNPRKPR